MAVRARIIVNLDNRKFYPQFFTEEFGGKDWYFHEISDTGLVYFDNLESAKEYVNGYLKNDPEYYLF
jgi:hypothetical protein